MKEKLTYTRGDMEIKFSFEDLNTTEFLSKTIELMSAIGYSNESIEEALNEVEI